MSNLVERSPHRERKKLNEARMLAGGYQMKPSKSETHLHVSGSHKCYRFDLETTSEHSSVIQFVCSPTTNLEPQIILIAVLSIHTFDNHKIDVMHCILRER